VRQVDESFVIKNDKLLQFLIHSVLLKNIKNIFKLINLLTNYYSTYKLSLDTTIYVELTCKITQQFNLCNSVIKKKYYIEIYYIEILYMYN